MFATLKGPPQPVLRNLVFRIIRSLPPFRTNVDWICPPPAAVRRRRCGRHTPPPTRVA